MGRGRCVFTRSWCPTSSTLRVPGRPLPPTMPLRLSRRMPPVLPLRLSCRMPRSLPTMRPLRFSRRTPRTRTALAHGPRSPRSSRPPLARGPRRPLLASGRSRGRCRQMLSRRLPPLGSRVIRTRVRRRQPLARRRRQRRLWLRGRRQLPLLRRRQRRPWLRGRQQQPPLRRRQQRPWLRGGRQQPLLSRRQRRPWLRGRRQPPLLSRRQRRPWLRCRCVHSLPRRGHRSGRRPWVIRHPTGIRAAGCAGEPSASAPPWGPGT